MSAIRTHPIRVGPVEARVLDNGPIEAPGAFLFANADPEHRPAALRAAGLDPGAVPVGLAGMLVKTAAGERILLDAGTGGRWHEGLGRLPTALERIGCSPVAVDLVVVSHGHPDHLGGLLDDTGRLRFPEGGTSCPKRNGGSGRRGGRSPAWNRHGPRSPGRCSRDWRTAVAHERRHRDRRRRVYAPLPEAHSRTYRGQSGLRG